jgi:predicted metal-dependent phosphoesterase TrpH
MRRKVEALLCELHAHTQWSDGSLSVAELVDLYGRNGFDVLAVTDHVVRPGATPWSVHSGNYRDYLAEVTEQAERARREYDLLVIPGLELTYDDPDPDLAAHAVAVGCRSFVSVESGIEQALWSARMTEAAVIAAHPYDGALKSSSPIRPTQRFARDWRELRCLVDRWELFNRYELFAWVAENGLPAVANGDFHVAGHLYGWKTLLPCAKDEGAVTTYLRSNGPAFLTRIDEVALLNAA